MSHAQKSATLKCFLHCLILLAINLIVLVQPTPAQDSAPAQDSSLGLFGRTWTLTEMEERHFRADKPNIEFNRDTKRVSGSGGCNRFGGTFEIDGSMIKFSRIFSTKMACLDAEVQRTETSFLQLLETTTRFEVEGNKLRLYAGDVASLVFVDRAANPQTGPSSIPGRVTGTISYRQRIALTPRAVVEVRLLDISRAGGPSITIAQETIKPAGRQVPIAFELTYDARRIGPRGRYSVQVRILDRNKVRFRTTDAYLVITGGYPNEVNVIVKPVSK